VAGSYLVDAVVTADDSSAGVCNLGIRLQNTTDATTLAAASAVQDLAGSGDTNIKLIGSFVLAATKTVQLQAITDIGAVRNMIIKAAAGVNGTGNFQTRLRIIKYA
jgi:hypothetical protein